MGCNSDSVMQGDNTWRKQDLGHGADIKLDIIHGTYKIKTDSNPIPCDKIGNLPDY